MTNGIHPSDSLSHPAPASAPGKLILCGEHAVVYGRPAIALPLKHLRAYAQCAPDSSGNGLTIHAPDLGESWAVEAQPDHPLSELVRAVLRRLEATPAHLSGLSITLRSDIPIAGGMGSGAALATALVRTLCEHLGQPLVAEEISALVYGSEQRYHGTPSGIDNTVVAHEQAIWFERVTAAEAQNQQPITSEEMFVSRLQYAASAPAGSTQPVSIIEPLDIGEPLILVIGDTGLRSETHLPVGEVRRRWLADPDGYDMLFNRVGSLVRQMRVALASGDITSLGLLMNENQDALQEMGVSSPALEHLIEAARDAGAWGAKLSGGGWGGIMVALADEMSSDAVAEALHQAGATHVLTTTSD